ncbi:MAG TPA: AI-2E family transporter [Candidatus Limnocylindrales bacterium]
MRREAADWFVRGLGLALGALIVYGILYASLLAVRVIVLVFVAILIGSALEPIVGWLRIRLPVGRGAAILVVYASFFVAVAILLLLVVPAAAAQFGDLAGRVPAFLDRVGAFVDGLRPPLLAQAGRTLVAYARAATATGAPPPAEVVVQAGLTVAEVVASVVSLLAIVFFWLTEHARLQRYVLAFLPAHRRGGARDAWNEVESRLGMWVRGQLILMAALALATGVAYTLLGLPSSILLAVLAGLAEAIPLVGPALGAVPALLVAATVRPELVVLVAVVYIVLQLIEGNVLVPFVMRNTIGLSPFLVIVSLLLGDAVGGVPGAILGVPVAAAIEVVLERLQARDTPVAQDPGGSLSPEARDELERSLPDGSTGATTH